MLKILIIDDELNARNVLHHLIIDFIPEITEIRVAASAAEAQEILRFYLPDIVFLDIEMPNMNGITFAKKANLDNTEIIYTTAYQKYAIDAFRVCAFDFLLKPVDRHELLQSVNRLSEKLKQRTPTNVSKLHARYNKITIHTTKGMLFVPMQNILWMESDNNYTTLHLTEGKSIITSRSIGDFELMLLEFDFYRIHQSALINLQHLQEYIKGDGGSVILTNGKEIEVSRRRKADLLALIG